MNTATMEMVTARHIARAAEQQIKTETGIRYRVMLYADEQKIKKPEQMLRIIAGALNMNIQYYRYKGRQRDIVELRFIAATMLRKYYPYITLKQIAALFGGQDHTSVMNALATACKLLDTNETRFTRKYNTALKTVNQWLREE